MNNEKLNIGIIGCGYWGGNYVRLFTELMETDVVMVCDQKPDNLAKIEKRYPQIELTTELDDVLNRDDIDAVVIATNATTHFDITSRCIKAGKHILLEKPMTTTSADAEALIELADVHNVTLMIGHIYLYNAGINLMKSYVEEKKIGETYYLYARRTNLGPIRYDVNALWDLAPHDISVLNYILGSTPEWVSAVGHKALRNCREDVGFIVLGYPNNVIGQIHVSWTDPDKVREIVVVGSEERIVFNDLNPQEPVRIFERGVLPVQEDVPADGLPSYAEHQFSIRNGNIVSPSLPISEPLKEQCLHFIECIQTGQQPRSDGANGLDVVRVMEAINLSIEHRGTPVTLETETVQWVS